MAEIQHFNGIEVVTFRTFAYQEYQSRQIPELRGFRGEDFCLTAEYIDDSCKIYLWHIYPIPVYTGPFGPIAGRLYGVDNNSFRGIPPRSSGVNIKWLDGLERNAINGDVVGVNIPNILVPANTQLSIVTKKWVVDPEVRKRINSLFNR